MRPRLLDLFRGEGGASEGYKRAGFDVLGVDRNANVLRRGPGGGMHAGDALAVLRTLLAGRTVQFSTGNGGAHWLGLWNFAAIHASPPCQGYSISTAGNPAARAKHKRLIAATRDLLVATELPWVIENVEQAGSQMVDPVMLCGSHFALAAYDEDDTLVRLERHRLFESNVALSAYSCYHDRSIPVAGVYGGSRRAKRRCPRDEKGRVICKGLPCEHENYAALAPRDRDAARLERGGGYVPRSKAVQQRLLGIDWMSIKGMQESIPPVYAEWVGTQLLAHVGEVAA